MQGAFHQILLLMATAVAVSIFFKRFQLPSVLAYMIVGLLLGPFVLNWLDFTENIIFVSELGLVFLLFTLGLEFSIPKMIALRRLVLWLGGLQVLISTLVTIGVILFFDVNFATAFALAGALAMSSTAIVTKELNSSKSLNTSYGQAIVSVLIFQDIAAVAFMIMVPVLAGDKSVDFTSITLAYDLLKGSVLFVVMIVAGKWLSPRVFNIIVKTESEELFSLSVLFLALFAGAITHAVGLSMELGAFIAGMLLAESRHTHQIETNIRPFRDILLALFFIYVGMLIDPFAVIKNIDVVVLGLSLLLISKAVIIFALAKWLRKTTANSVRIALYLAQGGEFGFALIAIAVKNNLMDSELSALVIAIVVLSMALTPLLVRLAENIAKNMEKETQKIKEKEEECNEALPVLDLKEHVIICGFGRTGQIIHRFLAKENIEHIAVDTDKDKVNLASSLGEPVIYGNAKNKKVLDALHLDKAKLVVISVGMKEVSKKIIKMVREQNGDIPVLVRTIDESGIDELKELGATDIVPEVLEGSLTLVSHALLTAGMPFYKVSSLVRKARMDKYDILRRYDYGKNPEDSGLAKGQRMQAVYLTEDAWAIGKSLQDLDLPLLEVQAVTLKRQEENISYPEEDIIIEEADTLVICGNSNMVEEAEHRLLVGF